MIKNTHDFKPIEGKYVNLREAEIEDSEFILSLRTDPKKSRFINKTDSDLQKQIEYMKRYKTFSDEWYFIVENKKGVSIGTQRIYLYPKLAECWINQEDPSKGFYGPGSWLLKDGTSPMESIESDYLVKKFFFETLNFSVHPMMIHESNKTVLSFHQKWGAKIFGYDDASNHHLLNLTKDDFEQNKGYFEKFLYGRNKNAV